MARRSVGSCAPHPGESGIGSAAITRARATQQVLLACPLYRIFERHPRDPARRHGDRAADEAGVFQERKARLARALIRMLAQQSARRVVVTVPVRASSPNAAGKTREPKIIGVAVFAVERLQPWPRRRGHGCCI